MFTGVCKPRHDTMRRANVDHHNFFGHCSKMGKPLNLDRVSSHTFRDAVLSRLKTFIDSESRFQYNGEVISKLAALGNTFESFELSTAHLAAVPPTSPEVFIRVMTRHRWIYYNFENFGVVSASLWDITLRLINAVFNLGF